MSTYKLPPRYLEHHCCILQRIFSILRANIMPQSQEDHIVTLKLKLQKLEREREGLSAQIAATRAELHAAKNAQQVHRPRICFQWEDPQLTLCRKALRLPYQPEQLQGPDLLA